jgi:hypothetical protein
MGVRQGFNAKLYRLTSGTRAAWPASGAPSNLSEIGNVRDLSVRSTTSELDATTRASAGFKVTVPGLNDAAIEFEMVWDTDDTHFTALKDAYEDRTSVAIAALDKDKATSGAKGLWADFAVVTFEKQEPLDDVQKVSVVLKPTYSAVAPEWVTVGP